MTKTKKLSLLHKQMIPGLPHMKLESPPASKKRSGVFGSPQMLQSGETGNRREGKRKYNVRAETEAGDNPGSSTEKRKGGQKKYPTRKSKESAQPDLERSLHSTEPNLRSLLESCPQLALPVIQAESFLSAPYWRWRSGWRPHSWQANAPDLVGLSRARLTLHYIGPM